MEATDPSALRVLVIDDEKNIRTTLTVCLESMGCVVSAVESARAALDAAAHASYDLAFVDLRLGRANGMDLLPQLLSLRPRLMLIVVTAYATFETAVEAIKRGAADYLPKPFTPAQIRHVVDQCLQRRALAQKVVGLQNQLDAEVPEVSLDTAAPPMRLVFDTVARAALSDAPILLRGESGTGKGVLARTLHAQSRRRDGPFVTVNCPTLSQELLVSELFGHMKGAFTGAVRDQPGRVEAAEGGTLFLDEIAELSPGLQAKLLRFLQDKQFERVGDSRTRHANVRVVAATNRNIEEDVQTGHFRNDLLFRLNVIEVRVPPLRDRPADIIALALRFLAFFARAAGRAPVPELTPAGVSCLVAYPWPGNVRELRNVIERALILWPAQLLGPEAFPDAVAAHAAPCPRLGGPFTLEEIEKEHILRVLHTTPEQEEAARVLGIDASTLWRKRKKYSQDAG